MITALEIRTLLSTDFVLERDRQLRDGAQPNGLKYDAGTHPPLKPPVLSSAP